MASKRAVIKRLAKKTLSGKIAWSVCDVHQCIVVIAYYCILFVRGAGVNISS
jgi:hypothetical protein